MRRPLYPSGGGQQATLNVMLVNHHGSAFIDIAPPGNALLGEMRILKKDKIGTVASTTIAVPTDQPVQLIYLEKIYGQYCQGQFIFNAVEGATYDVVGGDVLPSDPALIDRISRIWAVDAGTECYFQVFKHESNGLMVAVPQTK